MQGHMQDVCVWEYKVQGLRVSGASLTLVEPWVIKQSQLLEGQQVWISTVKGAPFEHPSDPGASRLGGGVWYGGCGYT